MSNFVSKQAIAKAQHSRTPLFGVRQERQDLHCAGFDEWLLQQMAAVCSDAPIIIATRSSAYLYGNRCGADVLDPIIYFDSTLRKLEKSYSPFLQEYADHLVASTCRLVKTRPVYLRRPLPEMPVDVPRVKARATQLGRPAGVATALATYDQGHARTQAALDSANPPVARTFSTHWRTCTTANSAKASIPPHPATATISIWTKLTSAGWCRCMPPLLAAT